jgi:hypothetical protein
MDDIMAEGYRIDFMIINLLWLGFLTFGEVNEIIHRRLSSGLGAYIPSRYSCMIFALQWLIRKFEQGGNYFGGSSR